MACPTPVLLDCFVFLFSLFYIVAVIVACSTAENARGESYVWKCERSELHENLHFSQSS